MSSYIIGISGNMGLKALLMIYLNRIEINDTEKT